MERKNFTICYDFFRKMLLKKKDGKSKRVVRVLWLADE